MGKHSFPNGKRLVRDTLKPDDNLHYEKFSDGTVKCIEDEIPFELPEGGEWTRLGCITDVIQYGLSNSAESTGNYRLLRITDIQNGCVNWDTVPFTSTDEPEKYLLHKDDIVFARTGATVGKSFLITDLPYASVYASYLIRIRLINGISANYIYHFFNSYCYWEQVTDKAVGVGQPNCNGTALRELFIPLPSQAEQIRIVPVADNLLKIVDTITSEQESLSELIQTTKSKILDLAIRGKLVAQDPNDEPASVLLKRIRAEKEELIKQGKIKRDKKESVIFKGDDNSYYLRSSDNNSYDVAMIFNLPKNWEWCLLSDIFNVSSSKRVLKNEWKSSGVPFYRAREIVKLSINGTVDNDLFISPEHYENLRRNYGVPNAGDLMVTGVGTIGKVYIVKENDVFYYKDASVLCFENIYKAINPRFAKLMLDSSLIQNQIHSKTYGNTVDTITISTAKNYLCVLPPLAEQKRIVDEIEKIFATLDNIANQVA
ncbi:restriction endonuclease subunit S [Ruminococcus bromii]|nr:restriction endonuclease subunit S [Ruminococcus bromii]